MSSRHVLEFTTIWCLSLHLISLPGFVAPSQTCVCLKNETSGLYNPIHIQFRDKRYYIAEQRGIVRYFETRDKKSGVLLDLSDRVVLTDTPADQRGLLGFTLHPRYNENGKLYVYYIGNSSGVQFSYISEFTVVDDVALPTTERLLLRIEQITDAGNAGQLLFGHDGYLYISVGDGIGDDGVPRDHAQDPTSLLGKILRLDVDGQSFMGGSALRYGIPASNPFVDKSPWRREVFAYGCRNMWRCSQDTVADKNGERRIFCGDPGARAYEEIDVIRSGRNYGWNIREGNECFDSSRCSNGTIENEALPIYVYNHTNLFHAIVGGYVYRGKKLPDLYGRYLYGDAMTGVMSALTEGSDGWTSSPLPVCDRKNCPCGARERPRNFILTFGQDEQGEMYLLTTSSVTAFKDDGVALKIVSSLGEKTVTCGCGGRGDSTVVVVMLMMSVLTWFGSWSVEDVD
ncbi:HHIP-like protein 1 isoform X2 [Haliotis rufescens]|uniref:HHIP-like protein 1 isoform X2 n=1 Tax=Haliotis rufescens TaxID=6454 RepID=UPI00201EE21A|nr:HHIP-like protein 1 isoform X2 [Haliotis rufescens]